MSEQQYQSQQGDGGLGMQQPMQQPMGQGYAPYSPGMMGTRSFGVRRQYPIETKPFFLTSEFLTFTLATIALLITAAVDNSIDARFFWILETALVAFYMLARGLAKAGTKSRSADPREDLLRKDDSTR
jgi:hypothetical protein